MNLQQYNQKIDEVFVSDLPKIPKATALSLIAKEIRGCLWQRWAKSEALQLAARAESLSDELGGESLDGMDFLAAQGLLKKC